MALRAKTLFRNPRNRENGRRWTPEIIGGAILAMESLGLKTYMGPIQAYNQNLYNAISNLPGRWKKIITDMGFEPEEIRSGKKMLPDSEMQNMAKPEQPQINGFKER